MNTGIKIDATTPASALTPPPVPHLCAQCLSAKARHLAEYEMKDPRILALVVSLTGWEMDQR